MFFLSQRLVVLGHETINSQVYTQLDPNHCHIMTEYLNRYALIGESVPGGKAVKIYRLAAFAPALPPSMDYSIRVYVVEDTQDALDVSNLSSFAVVLLHLPSFRPVLELSSRGRFSVSPFFFLSSCSSS